MQLVFDLVKCQMVNTISYTILLVSCAVELHYVHVNRTRVILEGD